MPPRPSWLCFLILFSISNTVPSTIITAPSTIIPKSMAPRLIKLALTPKSRIMMRANSKDSGMTDAAMRPPRKLPNNSTSTNITMSAPSVKLRAMVLVVRSIRLDRSRKGLMSMPSGSDFLTLSMRSFTALTTLSELAPLSIMIIPPTAS